MNKIVIGIISELSDIEISEINLTSSFKDLGFDSLDLAELIIDIEDELEITTSDSMYRVKTVGELIEGLNKQVKNKQK